MKAMKSKWLALFLAVIMTFTLLPSVVFAAGADTGVAKIGDQTYNSVAEAITAAGSNATTIELTQNVSEDVTIPQGANITLYIPEGITLTNKVGHTITNNGTLTVTGAGTVDNVTHAKGALVNYGTAILEGATFTRSAEASTSTTSSGGNSWYVIDNHGTMTITGTANVVNNGYFSSLIRNIGTADAASSLTVSGNATLRQDNFIALKNDDYGNVAVTGGTITSNEQAIQNWSQAAISGGTLNGQVITWSYEGFASATEISGNAVVNGDVVAVNYDGGTSIPSVTIKGGTITGEISKATYNNGLQPAAPDAASSSIVVSGGTFSNAVDSNFFADNFYLHQNPDGSYSVHEHNMVMKYDAENHWYECSVCGEKADVSAHTFGEWNITKEATATEAGSREKVCSVCGYQVVEEIPATGDASSTPTEEEMTNGTTTIDTDVNSANPQTSDNSYVFLGITLLCLSGAGLAGTVIFRKKYSK